MSPFLRRLLAGIGIHSRGPQSPAPTGPLPPGAKRFDELVDGDDFLSSMDANSGRIRLVSAEKDIVSALAAESARMTGEGMRPAEQSELLWLSASSLWAMVAIGAIASNLAGVPLKATRKSRKGKEEDAPDSPLQQLLDMPSEGLDGYDLIEQFVTYLEAAGSSFCAVVRQDAQSLDATNGKPAGLSVLRPTRIEIVPGGEWIQSYKYRLTASETVIPAQNVIYSRIFHPMNDFWGLPRLNAVLNSIQSDRNLELYNAAVLKRHGSPSWFLETDQPVDRNVRRRVRREWEEQHGSPEKAGGVVVADRGMKAKPSGMSPKDMEFEKLAKVSKRRIFGAFGVPPAIGGDFDEASELANARSQRNIFYEHTLQPRSRKIVGPFSRMARAEFGDEWGVRMAWEEVDIVREEDLLERKEAREDFRAGIITRNEARQASNHEPIEGEKGDEFVQPAPSPFAGREPAPPEKRLAAEPAVATPTKALAAELDAETKARAQAHDHMRRLARATFERRYRRWKPKTKGALESFFHEESERVLARVRAMLGDGGDKALQKATISPDDLLSGIFVERAEADAFRKKIGPVFLAAMVDAGNSKMEDLLPEDLVLAFVESNARITKAIDDWTASRVVGITKETQSGLRDVIEEQYEEGANSRAMQDAIASFFREMSVGPAGPGNVDSRVERIARTETATFLNTGGFEADLQIEDAGGKVVKSWLSVRDELVRESHVEADSATRDAPIGMRENFANGLRYPNDPGAPAEEVVNCRCSLIEEVVSPPKVPA